MTKVLVVLCHGLNGGKQDFHFFKKYISQYKFEILTSKSNLEEKTNDGLKECGRRLAEEILDYIRDRDDKFYLILIGHSLGGLIARSCLVDLFGNKLSSNIIPLSFITICTPHLGVKRYKGSLFSSLFSLGVDYFCRNSKSKTTLELIHEDEEKYLMKLCSKEYLQALDKFKFKTLIGLAFNDYLVPYASSLISIKNHHKNLELDENKCDILSCSNFENVYLKEIFQNVKLIETSKYQDHILSGFQTDNNFELSFPGEMFKELNTIKWRRIEIGGSIKSECKKLSYIQFWTIQVHHLPIGNVFLSGDIFGKENTKEMFQETDKYMKVLTKMMIQDISEN